MKFISLDLGLKTVDFRLKTAAKTSPSPNLSLGERDGVRGLVCRP